MGTGERTVPLVDDVLELLPHLTGDEVAKVYDALPATATAWDDHYLGPRRHNLARTIFHAVVSRDGDAWKVETWAGGYECTTHPTARAAQAPERGRMDLRTYGVGAQILRECGVQKMQLMGQPRRMPSMAGYGLEITGYIPKE